MRLRAALLTVPAAAALLLAPVAAQAQWHRGPGWGGPPPRYAYHHHGGPGAGPFIAGALLGLGTAAVIAGAVQPAPVYAAPPVVYAPPPPPAVVYAAPPPAVVYAPAPRYYGW